MKQNVKEQCPGTELLFAYLNHPEELSREDQKYIEQHIRECSLCSEEVGIIKEDLEQGFLEGSSECGFEPIVSGPRTSYVLGRIRDLSDRYPHPSYHAFHVSKVQGWLDRLRKAGRSISDLFDISSISLPLLSPVAVRSGARAASVDEELL
jgi:hypothetical protein